MLERVLTFILGLPGPLAVNLAALISSDPFEPFSVQVRRSELAGKRPVEITPTRHADAIRSLEANRLAGWV